MRLASLFSGGKDSTYASFIASREREIAYLVTVKPRREDSWMFHTVNLHLVPLLAEAQGLELVTVDSSGEKEKELEDLKQALGGLDIDGIVSGAIASNYQKERVDAICDELGLVHVSPLWGRSSPELLDEVLEAGMEVVVTAVAAMGLDERWLGRVLDGDAAGELKRLSLRHGFDVCGEGGEMETLAVDAPWFGERLEIAGARKEWDGVRGSYVVEKARLVPRLRGA
ncbi:MAG: TIGR00289 family protein [Candidatus Bathyarchaeota archaeon]|nr:TIGR00289 family protein [Candidatus Bathyarchaeota archaeon]